MKLGIVGTGKIVTEALYAIKPIHQISLEAIYTREHSLEKAKTLAQEYQIKEIYTDYEKMLENKDIDTIYIGLINSVHYEYAKKALEWKKNVILEKPFTNTLKEAIELFKIAKENDLFLFEAITVVHTEVLLKMKEYLPSIGPIKLMLANYSQYSSQYDAYKNGIISPVFDPTLYGGALRDINVYNLHYAQFLFGNPKASIYYPNIGYNGVDTSGSVVLSYDGFSAICSAAKDSDSECFISIQGEKGTMRISGKPNVAPNLSITFASDSSSIVKDSAGAIVRPKETISFIPSSTYHRMTKEFIAFEEIIRTRDRKLSDALELQTLGVMKIIDGCENKE